MLPWVGILPQVSIRVNFKETGTGRISGRVSRGLLGKLNHCVIVRVSLRLEMFYDDFFYGED